MPMVMLAVGHDEVENCVRLDKVDPTCLFKDYKGYIQQEWHSYEDREMNGDRHYVKIGKPWTKLIFPRLSIEEWQYFATTLAAGEESVDVTAYLCNKDEDEYHYYNGTLHLNQSEPNSYEWGERYDVEIEIRDLTEITF